MKINTLLITIFFLLSLSGCEFYDHSNPLDPDYKGTMPLVKSVKQIYELGSKANCIKAFSESNIYVGTDNGLYHFDGNNWSKMNMPIQNPIINALDSYNSNNLFSIGSSTKNDGKDSTYLFKYDGINWTKIYSQRAEYSQNGPWNDWFVKLCVIGINDIYLAYSTQASTNKDKVIHWNNGSVTSFDISEDIFDIKVTETNKIYVLGKTKVWFYSGTNWISYIDISGKSFTEMQLLNSQTIYFYGSQFSNDESALYKYKDGFLNSVSSITNRSKVFGVHYLDENYGSIITGKGDFIIYNNGEYKSYNIYGNNYYPLYDVEMISKEVGFAVGSNGKILRYGDYPLER